MKYLYIILLFSVFEITVTNSYSKIYKKNSDSISLVIKHKSPNNETVKNGEIRIEISGGTAPYEVRCMGPEFNYKISDKTQFTLENLTKGEYLIIVRDQNGQLKHHKIQL